jgi:hypothetical protein
MRLMFTWANAIRSSLFRELTLLLCRGESYALTSCLVWGCCFRNGNNVFIKVEENHCPMESRVPNSDGV